VLERVLAVLMDVVAINVAILLAVLFRFQGELLPGYGVIFGMLAAPNTGICLLAFWWFGLYRFSPHHASLRELEAIVKADLLSTLLLGTVAFLWPLYLRTPRSIVLLAGLLIPVLVSGWRLILRFIEERRQQRIPHSSNAKRTLFVGAGDSGQRLAHVVRAYPQSQILPVGFLDDDPRKKGFSFEGLPVLGKAEDLPRLVRDKKIEQVVITIPSADAVTMDRLLQIAYQAKVPVQTLPSLPEMFETRNLKLTQLRPPNLEDLIGRRQVVLDQQQVAEYLSGQRVLITGAGGSIGSALAREVAQFHPELLILLGHGENSLFEIELELRSNVPDVAIAVVVADVRERERIVEVLRQYRPAVIFHAAAHKHVPFMEYYPSEAVKTNILGTRILAEVAEAHGVKRFVFISTDKAVRPTSVMGASKNVAEQMLRVMAQTSVTRFLVVRFGNVLGSRGSLLPILQKQMEWEKPVTITHPEMTRYFMTIPEAARLVLQAVSLGKDNEVFVLDMGRPVKIQHLVESYIRMMGKEPGVEVPIVYTGTRPGEKLYEEPLDAEEELLPTSTKEILIAKPKAVDPDRLQQALVSLEAAAQAGADQEIVRLLEQIVPDYAPNRDFLVIGKPGTEGPDPQADEKPQA
jgi:FlaA1/EpsC-like NDP-sugar epimerase